MFAWSAKSNRNIVPCVNDVEWDPRISFCPAALYTAFFFFALFCPLLQFIVKFLFLRNSTKLEPISYRLFPYT